MKRMFHYAACFVFALAASAADLVPVPELGVRIQRGFTIGLVADNDTAPDTWCMTFDARERLVVGNGQSIHTLTDTDGDDLADVATVFTPLRRGAMGLCFEGTTLYAVADEALLRFIDSDENGVADGPGEKLAGYGFGEHGAHMIRKGPDGCWYLTGGNDTGLTPAHITDPNSPIIKVEGGAFLRFGPNFGGCEVFAHGFRNCYDFSFNWLGDLFTYDSDTERDMFLPWYVPTRAYHVGYAQHHGWRLPGYKRSWPRPEYYPDTVNLLGRFGRGSPTGVVVYRHTQFPPAYREGLFLADWTFGRVYFAPLAVNGASYADLQPEVFIEPMQRHGFAPTALAVSPDGAVYVAIGGRKTRGAVYRIEYAGDEVPSTVPPLASVDLNTVLLAPQPLDAWSRATWLPVAQRLGAQPFAAVATEEAYSPVVRVRAIEVLTELFAGVPPPRVPLISRSRSPEVRARLAWSIGRTANAESLPALPALAADAVPYVRRSAFEGLLENPGEFQPVPLARVISRGLGDLDKDVRLAAARLASDASGETWTALQDDFRSLTPLGQTMALLAETWRSPDSLAFPQLLPRLTNHLSRSREPLVRLNAVRLMILSMGDWKLNEPSSEVFTGYETATPVHAAPDVTAALRLVRDIIPSGSVELDAEAARLLAMHGDDDARVARAMAQNLTDSSDASLDFHYLACLAKLRAPLTNYAPRIARSILLLDRKLAGDTQRVKQSWDARLAELVTHMVRREPAVGEALLRDPLFPAPAHVELGLSFTGEKRVAAARRFLTAIRATPRYPWTPSLVELLSALPKEEVFPIFRHFARNPALRDSVVLKLAATPAPADRQLFLGSLGSAQPQVVTASLEALLKLPPDPAGTNLVGPLRLLRRAVTEPSQVQQRAQLVSLISTSLKNQFRIQEPPGGDVEAMRAAYRPIFDWIGARYPGLIRAINADDGEDPVRWAGILRSIPWANGRAERGREVFTERGCAACHSAGAALGPDLAGSAQRMSKDDVMNAIAFPSRDIAPSYRSTTFRMRDGQVINGLVAFESADGWIVQTGAGQAVRLDSREVVAREPSNVSLMPSGLLSGLSPVSLADLYAYLVSIEARPPR